LGIVNGREHLDTYEFARGKLQAASAALNELDRMSGLRFSSGAVRANLKADYEKRMKKEQNQIDELKLDRVAIAAQESQWARQHLLLTEKNHVINAFRQGDLDQEVYNKLLADIDARMLQLESGDTETTAADPGLAGPGDPNASPKVPDPAKPRASAESSLEGSKAAPPEDLPEGNPDTDLTQETTTHPEGTRGLHRTDRNGPSC